MHPKDKMNEDLKTAMKAGDTFRREKLRLILAELKQFEVDKRITLDEEGVFAILAKEVKKRRESLEEARGAGRDDLTEEGEKEIALLESYMPTQLTREEVEVEVKKVIEETGATSAKDMGKVMKVIVPLMKGKADGQLVNDVVKALLS